MESTGTSCGLQKGKWAYSQKPHSWEEALRPNKDVKVHVLRSKLVQPLEELVLDLQVLHDGLHHQVHAVDYRRRVRVGRYVAQGLLHKLTACLLPGKEGDIH